MPGNDPWTNLPNVYHDGSRANLNGNWYDNRYHDNAMPSLREYTSKKERLWAFLFSKGFNPSTKHLPRFI